LGLRRSGRRSLLLLPCSALLFSGLLTLPADRLFLRTSSPLERLGLLSAATVLFSLAARSLARRLGLRRSGRRLLLLLSGSAFLFSSLLTLPAERLFLRTAGPFECLGLLSAATVLFSLAARSLARRLGLRRSGRGLLLLLSGSAFLFSSLLTLPANQLRRIRLSAWNSARPLRPKCIHRAPAVRRLGRFLTRAPGCRFRLALRVARFDSLRGLLSALPAPLQRLFTLLARAFHGVNSRNTEIRSRARLDRWLGLIRSATAQLLERSLTRPLRRIVRSRSLGRRTGSRRRQIGGLLTALTSLLLQLARSTPLFGHIARRGLTRLFTLLFQPIEQPLPLLGQTVLWAALRLLIARDRVVALLWPRLYAASVARPVRWLLSLFGRAIARFAAGAIPALRLLRELLTEGVQPGRRKFGQL